MVKATSITYTVTVDDSLDLNQVERYITMLDNVVGVSPSLPVLNPRGIIVTFRITDGERTGSFAQQIVKHELELSRLLDGGHAEQCKVCPGVHVRERV